MLCLSCYSCWGYSLLATAADGDEDLKLLVARKNTPKKRTTLIAKRLLAWRNTAFRPSTDYVL